MATGKKRPAKSSPRAANAKAEKTVKDLDRWARAAFRWMTAAELWIKYANEHLVHAEPGQPVTFSVVPPPPPPPPKYP